MSNERNMLTKTELKEERGWTDALIKCFVPNPDEEKINYTYSSKIKLYSIERIEKVEKSEDFKVAFEKAKKRKESAQRGADNRRIATLDAINSLVPIKMPKIPEQELLQQAIDSYNSMWANRGRSNGASINDNPDFLARITVNYIRHELTIDPVP